MFLPPFNFRGAAAMHLQARGTAQDGAVVPYQSQSLLAALVHDDLWVKITCPKGTDAVQVLVDVCK